MLLNTLIKTTQLTSWPSWDSTQVRAAVATLSISQEADPAQLKEFKGVVFCSSFRHSFRPRISASAPPPPFK